MLDLVIYISNFSVSFLGLSRFLQEQHFLQSVKGNQKMFYVCKNQSLTAGSGINDHQIKGNACMPRYYVNTSIETMPSIQKYRKMHVQKYCKSKNLDQGYLSLRVLNQIEVDDKHKILYCAIPKAGSTVITRKMLMVANNDKMETTLQDINPHEHEDQRRYEINLYHSVS